MTSTQLLLALLLIPLVAGLIAFAMRWFGSVSRSLVTLIHLTSITLVLVFSVLVINRVLADGALTALGHWLHIDSLGAIFLALVGGVGFLTGLYSIGYMNHEVRNGEIDTKTLCNYYGFFSLFLSTMILVVIANNVILMWVAVEATTIGSAFLVGLYGQRTSLEAAWKYITICSVGVAFGLYGTVLIFSNASNIIADPEHATSWTVLVQHAQLLDPTLTTIAFVFVLIGFGTKAGLFPMHTWLPDSYAEAPSPVSALLSAALSNCAFLIIIRYYIIVSKTLGTELPQMMLLAFGIMSIACAALFIIVQRDIKRLLAYSSVENIGIVALAFGIGGPLGILAGLLHALNNSIAKALAFCGAGNILLKYGTRDMGAVKGVMNIMPATGVFFGIGVLALGGLPPFNVFVSEFLVVSAGIKSGNGWLTIVVMLLLAVVFAGMVRMVTCTLFGDAPDNVQKGELSILKLVPMAIFVVAMLWMGIRMPQPVVTLLENATKIVMNKGEVPLGVNLQTPLQMLIPSTTTPPAAAAPAAGK
jgi:hydrogenase-4 component F